MKNIDLRINICYDEHQDIQSVVDTVNQALRDTGLNATIIWPSIQNQRALSFKHQSQPEVVT